jgi:hypothetical protein
MADDNDDKINDENVSKEEWDFFKSHRNYKENPDGSVEFNDPVKEESEPTLEDPNTKYVPEDKSKSESGWGPFGPGCIFYQTNARPDRFIGGTPDFKLIEVIRKTREDIETGEIRESFITTKTYTACKPVKIIKHKSLLSYGLEVSEKFTIQFKGSEPSGNFTIKQKTRSEIVTRLKDGLALCESGIDIAINSQVLAFEKQNLIEINEDMSEVGFFLDENDKIRVSNVKIKTEVNKEDLKQAIEFIENSKKYYKGRLDLFATALKWGMIAPLGYIIKCKGKYIKFSFFTGITNSSKSTTGIYVLAMDGNHRNQSFLLSINNINTLPRLSDTVGDTTFPKLVDEVSLSTNDNTRYIINDLKIAIENRVLRSKYETSKSLAATPRYSLAPLILTSNPSVPNDAAFKKRIFHRNFPISEVHQDTEKIKDFGIFLTTNLYKLAALGDFRNWFIMNSPDTILTAIQSNDLSLLDIGKKLLKMAYVQVDIPVPEWLDQSLPEDQLEISLEDTKTSIINGFESLINNSVKNFLGTKAFDDYEARDGTTTHKLSLQERLSKIVDNNLLPYIKRRKIKKDIMINRGILDELYKFGVTRDELPNVKAFADYFGISYEKHGGSWVAAGNLSEISSKFDDENEQ